MSEKGRIISTPGGKTIIRRFNDLLDHIGKCEDCRTKFHEVNKHAENPLGSLVQGEDEIEGENST